MGLFDSWFERSARGVAQQFAAQRDGEARQGAGGIGDAAAAARRSHRVCGRCGIGRVGCVRQRDGGKRRSDELRLLEILRDRRLVVQLLRRHVEQLPTGTTPSPITWIGTRRNPHDGSDYIVSYNDCCGKTSCGKCFCNRNEREKLPKLSLNNDINWCMANGNSNYHWFRFCWERQNNERKQAGKFAVDAHDGRDGLLRSPARRKPCITRPARARSTRMRGVPPGWAGRAGRPAPPLTEYPGKYATAETGRAQLVATLLHGMFGEIKVRDKHYNFKMSFASASDDDIAHVLNYVVRYQRAAW